MMMEFMYSKKAERLTFGLAVVMFIVLSVIYASMIQQTLIYGCSSYQELMNLIVEHVSFLMLYLPLVYYLIKKVIVC